MTKKNNASYDEEIAPAKRAARAKQVAGFIADVKASETALVECGRQGILGVNKMLAAGRKWIAAGDKNQYDMYFYDLAETLVNPADKKYLTRTIVKTAIHFATILTEPVKTVAEAAPHMQKLLFTFGLDTPGRRLLENEHPPRNIFSELVSEAKTACGYLRELELKSPIAEWDTMRLDTFIREWRPVMARYQEAVRIRLGRPEENTTQLQTNAET